MRSSIDSDSDAGPPFDGRAFDPSNRLVIAMSGGVDSSVAAHLLREEGHPLVGLFMRNGVKLTAEEAGKKSCCSVNDARDARMVASKLGVPFQAVDLGVEFGGLIDYFVDEYRSGRTPNPCAVCNRDLKFKRLLELAVELGAVGVATGHYARIALEDGRVVLRRGVDRKKDQSYQLFSVEERFLARTRLPLGELEKPRVREIAAEMGLRTADKPDSQEICFVPGNDYRRLLAERGVEPNLGWIVDTAGRRLREHEGLERFTIGQRRGHGVGGSATPMYVVDLIPETGTVVLGTEDEGRSSWFETTIPNWIGIDPQPEAEFLVQIRYHHRPAEARVRLLEDGRARVDLAEPQLAVTSGQGAAFYLGDRMVGGGWIGRVERPTRGTAAGLAGEQRP